MLPELGAAYGVSAGTASLSVTAYLLTCAAVMLVSGTLGERWGRRRTVVVAYGVYVVASLACVLDITLPLASSATDPGVSMSTVQAVRFGGGALAPVAITPTHHADPLAARPGRLMDTCCCCAGPVDRIRCP